MIMRQMLIHYEPAAMSPKGSPEAEGKATSMEKMPSLFLN
jgi:hypothetical protein